MKYPTHKMLACAYMLAAVVFGALGADAAWVVGFLVLGRIELLAVGGSAEVTLRPLIPTVTRDAFYAWRDGGETTPKEKP